jgi:hypothetical protein
MILGLEIGLLIFGLIALIRGKMTLTKTKVVEGVPARLLGLLALTPLPIAILVGIGFVLVVAPANPEKAAKIADDNKLTLALVEAGIVIFITVLVFGIGAAIGKNPEEARRKKKRRRDEEEDYEDDEYEGARPRKRSRRDEEEDEYEEEDRPRKRSRQYDDEDDDDREDRRGRYR